MAFGKTPAPSGFGAPPPAGGFGAPAAGGGFGAAATAPSSGFGKAPAAGFGAPAAGGFGAPAAGGFGAPAAPASGFGKAPAAGGFGAPAAGGFGAPAAGGFGAAPAGGFGKAPVGAPTAAHIAFTGIAGPGYTAPNTPNWMGGTDLTQVTDDALVSKLPQNLKQHLGVLLEFSAKERQAKSELQTLYQELHSDTNAHGLRTLQHRLDALTTSTTQGIDHLMVDVFQRDRSIKKLSLRVKETEEQISAYSRDVWDRLQKSGPEYWQHKMNAREGPSLLFSNALDRVQELMVDMDRTISDMTTMLHPSSSRPASASSNLVSPHFSLVAPRNGVQLVQSSMQQAMASFLSLGGSVSSLHSRANRLRDHIARYYGEAEAEELFKAVHQDSIGGAVGGGTDDEEAAFLTFTVGDTMRGRVQGRHGGPTSRRHTVSNFVVGGGAQRHVMQYDPQLEQQHTGNATAQVASATTGGFGAPAAGAGFGQAPGPAAPLTSAVKGFGAAPAGGFGAPAAAPAGGAPTGQPATGFGAPAPATASVGFAQSLGAATPGPAAAALSNQQGLGATPAPTGFGAVATPQSGATPSMIAPTPAGQSMSTSNGSVTLGSSPEPTAASSDSRTKKRATSNAQ